MAKIWTYLLFDAFLFKSYEISTTNEQQTVDFGEVFEFWRVMNSSNEEKKVKASYIGV
jgi:hypothetical protein